VVKGGKYYLESKSNPLSSSAAMAVMKIKKKRNKEHVIKGKGVFSPSSHEDRFCLDCRPQHHGTSGVQNDTDCAFFASSCSTSRQAGSVRNKRQEKSSGRVHHHIIIQDVADNILCCAAA